MRKSLFALCMLLALLILAFVYRGWFGNLPLSAGDWSYHAASEVRNFFFFPQSWAFGLHAGLGGNGVFLASLETYFLASARLLHSITGLSWAISERIIWYFPFLIVGFYSSYYLAKTMVPKNNFVWLTPIIFLTNTYILIVTGGGQMGIGMSYAIAPLVFASFIRLYEVVSLRRSIIAGLLFAVMTGFDPRIAFILAMGMCVYLVPLMYLEKTFAWKKISLLSLPFFITLVLHAFWVLPLVLFRVNPIESLGAAYSSIGSVIFFSFGDFSHSLSLLHPNWPENLFGKVYFLQPEFLLMPMFAWGALIGLKDKKRFVPVMCFGWIALLGVFLSKGAKDPGGVVYLWMFERVPFFNVFRDPTKFYLLTVIAYSVMIPTTIDWISKKMPRGAVWKWLPGVVFLLFWLVTIREAVLGQLTGTFIPHSQPAEYVVLRNLMDTPEYFRTFWLPHTQRYGLSTYMHPAIDAGTVLDTSTPSAMLAWVHSKEGIEQLARWSVKYVILPYDSQGELFLDDRTYSPKLRSKYQQSLDVNSYLKKIQVPGMSTNISVYETPDYQDHIWVEESPAQSLRWRMNTPTSYEVEMPDVKEPVHLVMSETFDPYWQFRAGNITIKSNKTNDGLNSFVIPAGVSGAASIEYTPQKFVGYGLWVSGIALVLVMVAIIIL